MERTRARSRAAAVAGLVFLSTTVVAQSRVTFEQAAPVLNALPSNLPIGLRGRSRQDVARLWPAWADEHDRSVRARLARGDEDSLVNFWLYGTSFTSHPPAVARASPLPAAALDDIVTGRLDDLLNRVDTPGDNERLQFARRMLALRPKLKVLYLTGFSEQLFKDKVALWQDEAFLEKPCSVRGLMEAVSLLLFGRVESPQPAR